MSSSSSDDSPSPAPLVCPGCRKEYPNPYSLNRHRRRYCRPDADPTNRCIDCSRTFASFAGLQQHRKRAHPLAYQSQIERQDRRVIQPFSELEALHIVQAELEHEGAQAINVYLSERFQRPVAEIRNLRKRHGYIALRARFPPSPPHRGRPPPQPVWPSPPPPPDSPIDDTYHGQEGNESFDTWNVSGPPPSIGTSLADELNLVISSPPPTGSPAPPGSPPSSPPGSLPSPHQEDVQVPDPIREYLLSLATDPSTGGELSEICIAVASDVLASQREAIDLLLSRLWTPPAPSAPRGPPSRQHHPPIVRGPRSRVQRSRRAHRYKLYQELYTSDKSSLANLISKGLEPGLPDNVPSSDDIRLHYTDVFAVESPDDNQAILDQREPTPGLYLPFLEAQVKAAVQDRRASNAAGPDGMSAAALRSLPVRDITILFNSMVYAGYIPSPLKSCRTTLIPKGGADPANISSWRPITVASVIIRTLHRLLSARLVSAVPLHQSQRGFISLDGTMANTIMLQAAIKSCRAASRPYSVTSLDLRKAFDTVPHSSIRRAMSRFNFPTKLSSFIMEGLTGCSTTISCGSSRTDSISILRGVKQGDPLSPLLFNLVLDELLCDLDILPTGLKIGEANINSLAYADDLLLLTPSPEDMRILVGKCARFFEARSMGVNPAKCSNITVKLLPSRGKLYLSSNTSITIRAVPIPIINAESSFKYLGHRFGFMGTDPPSIEDLRGCIANLQRAPLKPYQKLTLLQDYILPKFLYSLQNPKVSLSTLDRADKFVRKFVKTALHIPSQTSNSFLYARRRDGGLGLMCLTSRIPDILLGRLGRLQRTGDARVLAAINCDYSAQLHTRLQRIIRPFGTGQRQASYWRHRLSTSVSGAGLPDHANNLAAHRWIRDPPPGWTGRDYVLAVQLRSNTMPTKGGLHNVRLPRNARLCRGGCQRIETLSHVLQRCPVTHHQRIARHDHAVRTLALACTRRGHTTDVEPCIRGSDGRLHKPDLIVKTPGHVYVVDVSINWETPRPLTDHFQNKVAIYSVPTFIDTIRQLYPDSTITVGAIVLGARGTWCHLNDSIIERLGIPKITLQSLVGGVLRGGAIIHKTFGASVWNDPRPPR